MYLAYVILMNFSHPLLHSAVDVQLILSAYLSPSAKVPEVGAACAEDQCLLGLGLEILRDENVTIFLVEVNFVS